MTKSEIKSVVNGLRNNVHYEGVSTEPLYGLGLDDFPNSKYVRREVIANFLNWQCMFLDGTIDESELSDCIYLLKKKRVVLV